MSGSEGHESMKVKHYRVTEELKHQIAKELLVPYSWLFGEDNGPVSPEAPVAWPTDKTPQASEKDHGPKRRSDHWASIT